MQKRRELRFPSFWVLQIAGWAAFYLLITLASIPYLKQEGTFRENNWFIALLFLSSCVLRPICRALYSRSLSWLALEVWAFAWSLVIGVAAAFFPDLLTVGFRKINWDELLINAVQLSVVLVLWCNLYFSIKQWRQSAEERERLLRAETEAREARLSALRYQLNPHFLFNSLNAVSTLVLEGNAPAATRMLAQLGEFLRATLDTKVVPELPLSDEIAFTERYLAIEQTRLGERLRVDLAISPETLDAMVPNMLLQPLVENAIRHGVGPLVGGGELAIHSERRDGRLRIVVRNSAAPASRHNGGGDGIGLRNTGERLRMLYGDDHKFALEWIDTEICEVVVELPFRS